MVFELKMLQVVIVTGEIQIDPVPPQQGIPLCDQLWVIAMLSVGVEGMMGSNRQKER